MSSSRTRAGGLLVLAAAAVAAGASAAETGKDWTRFGYDAARSNRGPAAAGITAANVRRLVRKRIVLDGTVDSSPILAGGLVVVTTSYGTVSYTHLTLPTIYSV